MIKAPGSPGAFFVPKLPHFRAKNRLKLPNYYPTKRQIFLEIRVVNGAQKLPERSLSSVADFSPDVFMQMGLKVEIELLFNSLFNG